MSSDNTDQNGYRVDSTGAPYKRLPGDLDTIGKPPSVQEATALVAQDTLLARGMYREFFEKNKAGIQYVDVQSRTYYISRQHTLHGPIPPGAKVAHTGLEAQYDAQGFKVPPKRRKKRSWNGKRRVR